MIFSRSTWVLAVVAAMVLVASLARADDLPKSEIVAPARIDPAPVPYPDGATGDAEVVVELEIEKDGTVGSVQVREGAAPFDQAVRSAAAGWRFAPATRNGLPIRARILAKVAFHPPPPPTPPPEAHEDAGAGATATPSPEPVAAAPVGDPVEVRVLGEGREELGSIHIPRHETRLVPGAFADPFRVVEVFPGVAPIVSALPYFTVRGAPPGDVGYSIDGIRVPLLFHVGAGPSVIAPALVDRVDLFPAVYPAKYGRAAGGIMAGETMAPSETGRAEAQARVFDAGGMVEQPFDDKRGSVLVGGRYGYTGALLALVAPDYSLAYWDYQARISYRVADHDRISAFGFGAYDFLRNEAINRTLFNVQFHRLDLRWDHDTESGHFRLATTLSTDKTLNAAENATDPGSGTTARGARVRAELDQRLGSGLRLRAGGDIGLEHFTRDDEVLGGGFVPFGPHDDSYGGGWIDVVARPRSGVEIVPGFRFDVLRVRNQLLLAPEPRLATRLRVAEGVAWISAFGLTHQAPTFLIPVPGANISVFESANQEVWQASQAIEVALPSRMLAKATVFRNVGFLDDVEGRSHNYGFELFLRRDFTERLGGFLSYTLSRADRERGTQEELSIFDRPQVLSVVLGYDLGHGFRFGARYYMESGRPYTVGCPTPGCAPLRAPPFPPSVGADSSSPYQATGRFPYFARLDTRFEKKWTFSKGEWIAATFEWFNALLAREKDNVQWTPQGIAITGRSPLTLPSIGVEAGY
jgi:TonB family protein